MTALRTLILFDVDGTLVDSQDDIVRSMTLSFEALGLTSPKRSEIVGIIGLSLETAVLRLMPGLAEPLYENWSLDTRLPTKVCGRTMAPRCPHRFIQTRALCCNHYGRSQIIFWAWQRGNHEEAWIFY